MTTAPEALAATTPAPVPGSPEHSAAMAAVFDKTQSPAASEVAAAPVKAERPAHVQEKFWDAEKGEVRWDDLAKSYAELEKKQGALKEPEKPVEAAPKVDPLKVPEASAEEAPQSAEEALADKGLDFNTFSQEFNQSGELSTESYEKLSKAGIPKEMVDAYIEGEVAKVELRRQSVFGEVGGEESYVSMVAWASKNLSKADQAAFNEAVDSPDISKVKLAVAGLNARFTAANGSEPNLLKGDNTPAAGDVFRSTQEMVQAMKDPRYAKDPAYQSEVQAKLARSSIL